MLIAMRVVVTIEERKLLLTVRRIVGGVEVKGETARPREAELVAANEVIDQNPLGPRQPAFAGAILETRERRLAGECGAVRPPIACGLEERLLAQRCSVIAVLVALADREDPLTHQVKERMLDEQGIAPLDERERQRSRQAQLVESAGALARRVAQSAARGAFAP